MANDYTFHQAATILNAIVQQAQGRAENTGHTPVNTSEFVSIANTTIQTVGLDPIMQSVTQMINRTIFAHRKYDRKFKVLENSDIAYGNAVRKITPLFTDSAETQPMYNSQPADGQMTDHWTIKRPKAIQTIIAGAEQWEVQAPTVFADQLKSAFRGPDELMQFLTAQTGEVQNDIEQQAEQLARNTVANFVGNIVLRAGDNHIHLLTEYNAQTGLSLTATTVYQPANFESFVKWMYARLNQISDRLTNRSVSYHSTIGDAVILRHTPKADQRLLLYSPIMRQIETMALSGIYHNDLLSVAEHESVEFWQDFDYPDRIDVTPSILNATGAPAVGTAVNQPNIVGVLFDRDAMGTNIFNQSVDVTPLNAKGRYYNTFHHFTKRYWNDITENGILFTLD